MENDAMHSASSGGEVDRVQGEPELGWVPDRAPYLGRFVPLEEKAALEYRAGLEEGLRRAAEAAQVQARAHGAIGKSSPEPVGAPVTHDLPIAPPRRSPSPHTPNGTRVPSGTPPRTPTPVFGSPNASPPDDASRRNRDMSVENRRDHPMARSAEWSSTVNQDVAHGDFWGAMGLGSSGSGVNHVGLGSSGLGATQLGLGSSGPGVNQLGSVGSLGLGVGQVGSAGSRDLYGSAGISGHPSGNFGPPTAGTGFGTTGLFTGHGSGGGSGSGLGSCGVSPDPPQPMSEGRNAFAPGDRTWWKLPPLPDPSTEDACIAVSDWLTQIQPIMSDLSDRSWAWWQRVMEVAQKAYLKWQQAGPLEKSLVVCDTPPDLLDPRLSRLEARALGMILESLPGRIKDELVVTKALTSTNAVYRILLAFQPGGLAERQKLISNLQEPGVAHTARYCSDQLRRWHRWLSRSQDLGVNPPDPAILLAGLDRLCGVVIAANVQLAFRCNISRTQHQLDFCPTIASVTAYARLLQAEMETLALSSSDPNLEETPKLTKKQRAAALKKEQAEAKATAKGAEMSGSSNTHVPPNSQSSQSSQAKGGQGTGKGASAASAGNGGGSGKGACKFYGTKGGCKMGRNCWSYHDFGKASSEGRCFNCGSTDHRADVCNRPRGKPAGKGEECTLRGESGSSSKGNQNASASGNGKGQTSQGNQGGKGEGKQVRQASAEPAQSGAEGTGTDPKVAKANEALGQDLIAEATKLLKGFRMAAARVVDDQECAEVPRLSESQGSEDPIDLPADGATPEDEEEPFYLTKVVKDPLKGARGLLDGGATNALRKARSKAELDSCTKTQVALALGHADLYLTPVGTLLSSGPVSPIVPMGVLVAELGCRVSWEGETCTVIHPKRGRLPVVMINRCPELCAKITEELITEIEDRRARMMQRALRLRALGISGCHLEPENSGYVEEMLEWLRKLSPDCPEGLLARVPPIWKDDLGGEDVPFNRRVRRAVQRADKVVIHLFSGKTKAQDFGHLPSSVYVLSIDIDQGADVLTDGVFQYLLELCISGKVLAIVGGPPCATISRLRERGNQDGGPRVLRDRSGPGRFGTLLRELSRSEQRITDDHTVMYLRMFLLHHMAHAASAEGVLFVLENPQDPEEYLKDGGNHASLWAWQEIGFLEEEKGMFRATFSQGSLGHPAAKPTTILVNDWGLFQELHGLHGVGEHRSPYHQDLQDRIQQSKTWAKWASGLTKAIGRAILKWAVTPALERQRVMHQEQAGVRALSQNDKAFIEHCERDHLGFRRDCRTCLEASVRSHLHMRQKYQHRNAFTLNVDLIGPLTSGEDQLGQARHLLIGVFGVPLFRDGRPQPCGDQVEDPVIPAEWEDDQVEGPEPPNAEDVFSPDAEGPAATEEAEDMGFDAQWEQRAQQWNDRWRAAIDALQEPVEVVPLVFVEPIASKRAITTLRGLQRIYTRIRLLNYPVRRVHSDSGREFANTLFEKWALARDIAITASIPSDPRSNGRIEGVVGQCKAGIRGLLNQSKLPPICWPHLARQWGEQKLRMGLKKLGAETPKRALVPAGTQVTVKKREWSRKTPWSSKAVQGVAVAPSVRVPDATIVRIAEGDGHRLYVAPVVYVDVKEPVQFVGTAEDADLLQHLPPPKRRVVGKRPGVIPERGGAPRGESAGESGSGGARGSGDGISSEARVSSQTLASLGKEQQVQRSLAEGCRLFESDCAQLIALQTWTPEQSERYSSHLLSLNRPPQRDEIEDLLRRSLQDFQAKTRAVDRLARNTGTKGWTMGFYVYGSKVGLTNRTRLMPLTARILNRYLESLLGMPEDSSASWTALRVTWGMQACVHNDRNMKGTKNWVVPISHFSKGRLWVAEDQAEQLDEQQSKQLVEWKGMWGRFLAGDDKGVWFDSSKPHAVEQAEGDRIVLVAYTPRGLHKCTPQDARTLKEMGFRLPSGAPDPPQVETVQVRSGNEPQYFDISSDSEEDLSPGEWAGTGEPQTQDQRVVRLSQLVREERKSMEEELSLGVAGVTPAVLAELQEDLQVAELLLEHDACEREAELGCSRFALQRLASVELALGELWKSVESRSMPQVRAVKRSAESSVLSTPPRVLNPMLGDVERGRSLESREHGRSLELESLERGRLVEPLEHGRSVELERGRLVEPLEHGRSVELERGRLLESLEHGRSVEIEHGRVLEQLEHDRSVESLGHGRSLKLVAPEGLVESLAVEPLAFDLRGELIPGESANELHPSFGLDTPELAAKGAQPTPGTLLQTRIISQSEVWGDIEAWRQPLTDEVTALKNVHQAVWPIGPEELKRLEQLATVSVIPGKGVYTQKPITNRLRARIVGCGNYLESTTPADHEAKGRSRAQDLYAGGVDGVSVRLQVSVAATKGWSSAGLDIKTAFLGAPLYQDGKGQAIITPGDLQSGNLDFEVLVKKLQAVQGDKVKIVVVTPPKILVRLGLVEESEKWLVVKALYGLAEAPRRWSAHRDMLLRGLSWLDHGRKYALEQCTADNNLWRIMSCDQSQTSEASVEQTSRVNNSGLSPNSRPEDSSLLKAASQDCSGLGLHGLLGVYVDDMLITAETDVQAGLLRELRKLWSTSEPEIAEVGRPLRFCGFNLHRLTGGGYLLNQEDYVQDLLQRFSDIEGTVEVPCLKEEELEPESPDPKQLKRAQAVTGALQWITTRTRPDICFAVNKTAQLMSRFPAYATKYAHNILRYLRGTQTLGLKFQPLSGSSDYGQGGELAAPRTAGLIEIYGDASFAPGNGKSQTGLVATLSGHVIAWASHRQSVTSQSSAESELYATSDGVLLLQTLEPLIQELHDSPVRKLVYNDNVGCVSLYSAPSGCWRTRHLRLKARGGRELLEAGFFEIRHLAGKWMLADIATKALHGQRHRELLQLLEMQTPASLEESAAQRKLCGEAGNLDSRLCREEGFERAMGVKSLVLAVSLLVLAASKITVTIEDRNEENPAFPLELVLTVGTLLMAIAGCIWCRWHPKSENKDPIEVRSLDSCNSEASVETDWSLVCAATEDGAELLSDQGASSGEPPSSWLRSRTLGPNLTHRYTRTPMEEVERDRTPAVAENSGVRNRDDSFVASSGMRDERTARPTLASFTLVSGLGKGLSAPDHGSVTGVGQEHPASNCGGITGVGQEHPASNCGGITGVGQEHPAPNRGGVTGVRQEHPAPIRGRVAGVREGLQAQGSGSGEGLPGGDECETHGSREAVSLEEVKIHPSWMPPKVPPRVLWPAPHPWAGMKGHWHQPTPVTARGDMWHHDQQRGVLVRFHAKVRTYKFQPGKCVLPLEVPLIWLTGNRRTYAKFTDGRTIIEDDDFHQNGAHKLGGDWTGRTEFEIRSSDA